MVVVEKRVSQRGDYIYMTLEVDEAQFLFWDEDDLLILALQNGAPVDAEVFSAYEASSPKQIFYFRWRK